MENYSKDLLNQNQRRKYAVEFINGFDKRVPKSLKQLDKIRKTPLMRVKDGAGYVLVGSQGGAPTDPVWVHNLRAEPQIELRDETVVRPMRVREVKDAAERARLWALAVAAYPPYADYQARTERQIPVFVAEP
jgi:deazaflavin-dependent oxidoreductase (nitroreductase family)